MFSDINFRPDELKVYPCSLIETAELMAFHKAGLWKPYTHQQLLDVLVHCLGNTPEYVRLSRVIRDISSDDIVTGNKITNFRELVEKECQSRGVHLKDIRSREIKNSQSSQSNLQLKKLTYKTSSSTEYFIQFTTKDTDKIAGFIRLSLPKSQKNFMPELSGSAMIRELHVYGRSLEIGQKLNKSTQHKGLGEKLIKQAIQITKDQNYSHLAVISAVGTREYYSKHGFTKQGLYQIKPLKK